MFIRGRYLLLGLAATIVISSGLTAWVLGGGTAGPTAALDGDTREFAKLMQTYRTLQEGYYKEVDQQSLVNGAINGMVKALDDPYSTYMDETEASAFHESIESKFEGIGAEIREEEGFIVVVSPIKGAPAEKAGVKPNDKIISVNGKSLAGMTASEAVKHIRGPKGSKAELQIQRAGETQEISITVIRDEIPLETVYSEMLDDGMGKIQITKFSETTTDEFKKALQDLQGQGMKGLVLDLRQNPGGLLNIAVELGNLLVPNNGMILQVEYRDGARDQYRSSLEGKPEFPVVVLVDGGSASAAEIMAAALQESGDVPLVGVKTFGKGTVQTAKDFSDGSNVKFTTAKWLTPDGNWIHEKGIEPDYKVELPAYADLPYLDPDKQLKQDSFSNEIKTAEQMLTALGYHPGIADGFFDDKTKSAVMAFQRMEGIKASGVIEGKTTLKMIELLQKQIKENDTQLDKAKQVLREMLP